MVCRYGCCARQPTLVIDRDINLELSLVFDCANLQVCFTTMIPMPAEEAPSAIKYPSLFRLGMHPDLEHVITVNEQFQSHVTKLWLVSLAK